jgi:hypothetical protein
MALELPRFFFCSLRATRWRLAGLSLAYVALSLFAKGHTLELVPVV